MLFRPLAAAVVAAALSLGAAACGGSSSSSSSSSAAGAGSTPIVSNGGSSTGSGSLAGGSGFCSEAKGKLQSLQAQLAQIATLSSEKEQLKQDLQVWQSTMQTAKADAPSQIQGDVTVMADFIQHVGDDLAKAGYDPLKAAATLGPYLNQNQAKFQTAANHIKAWAHTNCGV